MKERAPRSSWSAAELAILKHLMYLAVPYAVDYQRATFLLTGRTADEIKKRCSGIRDHERRKKKKELVAREAHARAHDPGGELHPAVVWVPTTCEDIEPIWVL